MPALSGLLVRGAPLSDALETATALTDESICRSLWRDTPRHFGVDFEGALTVKMEFSAFFKGFFPHFRACVQVFS